MPRSLLIPNAAPSVYQKYMFCILLPHQRADKLAVSKEEVANANINETHVLFCSNMSVAPILKWSKIQPNFHSEQEHGNCFNQYYYNTGHTDCIIVISYIVELTFFLRPNVYGFTALAIKVFVLQLYDV